MFPSATRVVSASFATGCHPARHELQGNTLALLENGRLVYHDAGHPDFLQHKRRATGRSLAVPTLAERLAPHGGMIMFSNVSPGAAFAHDPDGHGYVYHRAGSFAPGRKRIEGAQALDIAQDAAGERRMTERFVGEVLVERKPALAIIWMGEPDATQHLRPLGSPEHLAVLRQADANAARVVEAVDRLRDEGDEVLLIVCSDHGHQTVSRIVDVEAELMAAGLKESREFGDVVTPTSGTSTLVYVHPDHAAKIDAIGAFLASRDWIDRVVPPAELATVGQAPHHGLAFAISLKSDDAPNPFGVRGHSYESKPVAGKATHLRLRPARRPGEVRADAVPDDRRRRLHAGAVSARPNLPHRPRADHPGAPAAAGRGHGWATIAAAVAAAKRLSPARAGGSRRRSPS